MKYRFTYFWIALIVTCSSAQAQFEAVTVRLQSGKELSLVDLPWFNLGDNFNQYKDRAVDAEWLVVSPPEYCPYGNGFKVAWNSSVSKYKQTVIESCTKMQREKLTGLPSEVVKTCDCQVVLESQPNPPNGKTVWKSYNDVLLMSGEFKIRRTLYSEKEGLPILFSFGGKASGIYDFSGNRLCTYISDIQSSVQPEGAKSQLEEFIKIGDKPIPIQCFDSKRGEMDISRVSYSVFKAKIVGDIFIKFENGESYVIKPD